jgi:DtxR family Mn-dependent transcriptional regulator
MAQPKSVDPGGAPDPDSVHTTPRSDYIEAIRALMAENGGAPAKTSDIAARLGVSPPTVTETVQKMAREGLVEHTPYRGARFTPAGEAQAARIRRRRAILERFLAERLAFKADTAREEARRMEHAVSDGVVEGLCGLLGHPATAPDGGAMLRGVCCPVR